LTCSAEAPANVEKVGGERRILDEFMVAIESGAIDHAGDAAIELDVVQPYLELRLRGIFFVEIAKFAEFLLTRKSALSSRSSWRRERRVSVAGEHAGN